MNLLNKVPQEKPRPVTKATMTEPQEEFIEPEPTIPPAPDAEQQVAKAPANTPSPLPASE